MIFLDAGMRKPGCWTVRATLPGEEGGTSGLFDKNMEVLSFNHIPNCLSLADRDVLGSHRLWDAQGPKSLCDPGRLSQGPELEGENYGIGIPLPTLHTQTLLSATAVLLATS